MRFSSVYQVLDTTPVEECLGCGRREGVINRVCTACRRGKVSYFYRPWHERAACRRRDPSPWYTESFSSNRGESLASHSVRVAKAGCATCPVRRQCLVAGLYESEGVWGGTLPSERAGRTDVDVMLDEMTKQALENGLKGESAA